MNQNKVKKLKLLVLFRNYFYHFSKVSAIESFI